MNIALLVDTYIPQVNGVVTVVKQLKADLESLGCNCYVITPRRENSFAMDGVYYVKARKSIFATNEYIVTANYKEIMQFCVEHKIDILHAHSEFGMAKLGRKAAKKLNKPFVMTFHTFWEHYIKAYIPFWFLLPRHLLISIYTMYMYKDADVVYAVSQKVKEYLTRLLPNKKIVLIENAIDNSDFENPEKKPEVEKQIREKYELNADDFVMIYVGRVSHEKRLKQLLKIFENTQRQTSVSLKLLVIGDGPAKNTLTKLSEKLGLNKKVYFTGFISRDKLLDFFQVSDIFVSASLSETYSMTVTESLSAGVPVVLREDTCYFDRITHGENGLMAKSDKDFADALLELITKPEKLKMLKANCTPKQDGLTSMEQAKKYLASFEEIVKNKK